MAGPTKRREGATQAHGSGGAAAAVAPLDDLPVPVVVLDAAGVIAAANSALQRMCAGRGATPGLPWLECLAEAKDRARFARAFRSVRTRGPGAEVTTEVALLGPGEVAIPASLRLRASRSGTVFVAVSRRADAGAADPRAGVERALADSLGALDQGAVLLDGRGRVVEANRAAEALLGRLAPGAGFLERLPPPDVDRVVRVLSRAGAGSVRLEVEVAGEDGEPIPVELAVAVGDRAGAPGLVLVRDLRERRREAFEAQVTAQVDRALVQAADPRRAVLDACTAIARGFGADRVDVLVAMGTRVERWTAGPDGPRSVARVFGATGLPARFLSGPAFASIENEDCDPWLGVDGPIAPNGVRIALTAPSGTVGVLFVRHRAGRSYNERDQAFLSRLAGQVAFGVANGLLALETKALADYRAMLLDQSSVLVVSLDAAGRVLTWNRAGQRLLGVSAEEAVGKVFGCEVARADPPQVWKDALERLAATGTCTLEAALQDATGEQVPLHLEGRALAGGAAEGAVSVWVGLDLRVRRTLEAQVLRSQKLAAVGVLAAGIAHEINNPLSGVVGYAQLLAEREDLPPEVRRRIEHIQHSAERCRRIVEGVLLFSRRRPAAPRERADLREVVDRVIRLGAYQWRVRNAQILREPDESVFVRMDAERVEQVILNLVSNAVDAMPRGGTVRVGVTREGARARLDVEDEGEGIDPEVLPRIFDPFFSTKDVGKGTGLGLAISYGIVEEHGGTIHVDSRPGRGTRFTVWLPADEGGDEAPAGPAR